MTQDRLVPHDKIKFITDHVLSQIIYGGDKGWLYGYYTDHRFYVIWRIPEAKHLNTYVGIVVYPPEIRIYFVIGGRQIHEWTINVMHRDIDHRIHHDPEWWKGEILKLIDKFHKM